MKFMEDRRHNNCPDRCRQRENEHEQNKITDIVLCNNIAFAASYKTINAYREFLSQQPGLKKDAKGVDDSTKGKNNKKS